MATIFHSPFVFILAFLAPFHGPQIQVYAMECFEYVVYGNVRTWFTASTICQQSSGTLASVHSSQVNDELYSMVDQCGGDGCWIGIISYDGETHEKDSYAWADGSSMDFDGWAPTYPLNGVGQTGDYCGGFARDAGNVWYDAPCGSQYGFACQVAIPCPTALPTPTPTTMPTVFLDGFTYEFRTSKLSWNLAELDCRASGGYLASIHSQEVNDIVFNLCQPIPPENRCWIGLQEIGGDGEWAFTDEPETVVWRGNYTGTDTGEYTNWQSSEPSGSGMCVSMMINDGGTWDDRPCGALRSYVCTIAVPTSNPTTQPTLYQAPATPIPTLMTGYYPIPTPRITRTPATNVPVTNYSSPSSTLLPTLDPTASPTPSETLAPSSLPTSMPPPENYYDCSIKILGFGFLYWSIRAHNAIAIAFHVNKTNNWVGLGLGSQMISSDSVVGFPDGTVLQYHPVDYIDNPNPDPSQDISETSVELTESGIVVRFERKFVTGDMNDIAIVPGQEQDLVWSFGAYDYFGYHGPGPGRGYGTVDFQCSTPQPTPFITPAPSPIPDTNVDNPEETQAPTVSACFDSACTTEVSQCSEYNTCEAADQVVVSGECDVSLTAEDCWLFAGLSHPEGQNFDAFALLFKCRSVCGIPTASPSPNTTFIPTPIPTPFQATPAAIVPQPTQSPSNEPSKEETESEEAQSPSPVVESGCVVRAFCKMQWLNLVMIVTMAQIDLNG